jgi:type IV pilus assembly protein PilX
MRSRALLSRNEEGMVLALCLITLIVLSLIGVSATTTSRLEVEISGNDKTAKEAFYAAEMALIVGETVVESILSRADLEEDTIPGHYTKLNLNEWKTLMWDNTHSAVVATVPTGLKVSAPPRYIIGEWILRRDSFTTGFGVQRGVYEFDVTALGTGSSAESQTMLQSIYAKRYN